MQKRMLFKMIIFFLNFIFEFPFKESTRAIGATFFASVNVLSHHLLPTVSTMIPIIQQWALLTSYDISANISLNLFHTGIADSVQLSQDYDMT